MNFLIDAQLPRRLAHELGQQGHDATHTLDLPQGNRTSDRDIARLAGEQGRIVVTKDNDFVTSFLLSRSPRKLLLISTGNTANDVLLQLVKSNLPALETAFVGHDFVELTQSAIVIH